MNISTDIISGEIKDGKKINCLQFCFTVANSQIVYCLLLSWSELVFFEKDVFPQQTLYLQ